MVSRALPRLRRAALAAGLLCAAGGAAAFQFPRNPQSQAECDAAAEPGRAQARHEHERGSALNSQSNNIRTPPGCFSNEHCRSQYYAQKQQLHQQVMEHFRRRDEIQRQVDAGLRACKSVAAANERQREEAERQAREQQRQREQMQRQAEERQREAERQQRDAQRQAQDRQRDLERQQREAQRDAAERQRDAQRDAQERQQAFQRQQQQQQADFQRRQAELGAAMSDQLRRLQAAELERAQRAAGDPARNEPRIIGSLPPPNDAPGMRNAPRLVETPDTRLQAQQQVQQQQRQQQELEARILRDLGQQVWASVRGGVRATRPGVDQPDLRTVRRLAQGDAARADMLDAALNPDGARYAEIDERVRAADRANRSINALRGISPGAGQVAGDAYAGVGAQQQRTWQLFDQALTQIDAMGPTSPWPAPPPPPPPPTAAPAPAPPAPAPPAPPPVPAARSVAECMASPAAQQAACLAQVCTTSAGIGQPRCAPYRAQ